ncbi:MAG: hypothetical protein IPM34_08390 [Saprospiraceae bacterium]|nr:hypothetical protein [Saprospiraceae bacterium]
MDIFYNSKFPLRLALLAISLVSWNLLLTFFNGYGLNSTSLLINFSLYAVSFAVLLIHYWYRPKYYADDIKIQSEDPKRFFENPELMGQLVSLAAHYGFQRQQDYREAAEKKLLTLSRNRDILEDRGGANMQIWNSENGLLNIQINLKNSKMPGNASYQEFYTLSEEIRDLLK